VIAKMLLLHQAGYPKEVCPELVKRSLQESVEAFQKKIPTFPPHINVALMSIFFHSQNGKLFFQADKLQSLSPELAEASESLLSTIGDAIKRSKEAGSMPAT
jgi:hypothetical protein